jgi:serpin B
MRIATNNVVASFATGRAAVIVTRGTAEQPFFLDAARTVTVPLMRGSANLTYTENDQLQAVALPFRAPGMSMIVILPKKVDGLAEVEASLSVANLDEWIRGSLAGGRSSRAVEVFLPKFKMTTQIDLSGVLRAMGMPNAFSRSAYSAAFRRLPAWIDCVSAVCFTRPTSTSTRKAPKRPPPPLSR